MPCDTTSAAAPARPVVLVHVPAGGAPGLLVAPHTFLAGELWQRYAAATGGLKFVNQQPDGGRKGQLGDVVAVARAVAKLQADGFEVRAADATAAARLAEGANAAGSVARDADEHLALRVRELAERGLVPRPYQLDGIRWLRATRAGALLDEMGLGKTMQVLLAMGDRAVVFCPASVKGVWARECRTWRLDLRPVVLEGKGALRWPAQGELVIVNYDVVSETDVQEIGPAPAGTDLAIDEGHVVKNARTGRAKAVRAVAVAVEQGQGRRWIVTATPICNRPKELKAVLDAVGAFGTAFTSKAAFARAFGGAINSPKAEPTADAGPALARVSLRRLKADVAKDLPAKTIVRVPVQLAGKALELAAKIEAKLRPVVEDAEAQAATESRALGEDDAARAARRAAALERALGEAENIGEMSAFRRAVDGAMLPTVLEMVEAAEEAGQALVVASCFRDVCDALAKRDGWSCIVGGVRNDLRTDLVDAFQRGEGRGVALTLRAGGVGITLTRASVMIMTSRDWNPAITDQCEDRLHRIGQVQPVTIYHLHGGTWIEDRVDELCAHKRRMIAATMRDVTTQGGQVPEAPVLEDVAVGAPVRNPATLADAATLPPGWTTDAELVARVRALAANPDAPSVVGFLTKVLDERGGLPGKVRGEDLVSILATAEKRAAAKTKRVAREVALGAVPANERTSTVRPARDEREAFAGRAILTLEGRNGDGAQVRNDVGFNRMDTARGREIAAALAMEGMLSDDQWAWCVTKANFYRRQVGPLPAAPTPPASAEGDASPVTMTADEVATAATPLLERLSAVAAAG